MKRLFKRLLIATITLFTLLTSLIVLSNNVDVDAAVKRIEITNPNDSRIPAGIKNTDFYRAWKLLADNGVKYGSSNAARTGIPAWERDLAYVKKNGLNCADFVSWVYFHYLPTYTTNYNNDQIDYLKEAFVSAGKGGGSVSTAAKWWAQALSKLDYTGKKDAEGNQISTAIIYSDSVQSKRKKGEKRYNSALRIQSILMDRALSKDWWKELKPGAVITMYMDDQLYDPCHVMLYLGQVDGYIYICHSSTKVGHPVNIWRYEYNGSPFTMAAFSKMFTAYAGKEGGRIAAFNISLKAKDPTGSVYIHKLDDAGERELKGVTFTLKNNTTGDEYEFVEVQDEIIDDETILGDADYLYLPVPKDGTVTNVNDTTLKLGNYTLKETASIPGYKTTGKISINGEAFQNFNGSITFDVTAEKTTFGFEIKNDKQPTQIQILKTADCDQGLLDLAGGQYKLDGTEYKIFTNAAATKVAKDINGKDAVLTVGANGKTNILTMQENSEFQPMYYIKETKATEGFLLNRTVIPVKLTKENAVSKPYEVKTKNKPVLDPIDIVLTKQGKNSVKLEGAEFRMDYYAEDLANVAAANGKTPVRSWTFKTDANGYLSYKDSYKISGPELFKDGNGRTLALAGTYIVTETKAPANYIAAEPFMVKITISGERDYYKADGITPMSITVENGYTLTDESASFIRIKKTSSVASYNKPLTGAEFTVYTDSACTKIAKTNNTNVNAVITIKADGTSNEVELLPGTYYIKETKVPTGYLADNTIRTVTVASDEHKEVAIQNEPVPTVSTQANFKDNGEQIHISEGKVDIVDTVKLENLTVGVTYTVKGTLIDPASGNVIASAKDVTVKATASTMNVEVTFTGINAVTYKNKNLVVFEELLKDNKVIASHKEKTDEKQTVHFSDLKTKATDKVDNDNLIVNHGLQTIVDTITYSNLIPNKEYEIVTTLMDKATGKPIKDAVVKTKFTPTSANGEKKVEITFDASLLEGSALVVFEDINLNGKQVATHHDINDKDQTITVEEPSVGTTAKDKLDSDKAINDHGQQTIVDTVEYSNLIVGKEYTITTVLMDKKTGEQIKDVVASTKFTPSAKSGTVDVEITFDGSLVKGKTIVVFEDCLYEGEVIAVHHDLSDDKQTITVNEPSVGTTAKDKADNDKALMNHGTQTIVDTVAYENLNPGVEYSIITTLMDKASGEAILDAEGNKITAKATFKPEAQSGSVDVEITFDGSLIAGKTVVVFEDVLLNNKEIAVHHDLTDSKQTLTVKEPEIGTTAHDALDEDKAIINHGTQTIIDIVEFKNLIPGEEYTLTTVLMDKETGEQIECITATTTFKPEAPEGTTEVEITFDGALVAGKTIVVFEDCLYEGKTIAVHHEIDDEKQTVTVDEPKIGTTAKDKANDDNVILNHGTQTIIDTIAFENLMPGTEYTVITTLMDKSTKSALLDEEGKPITATTTFTPAEKNGTVDVEISFDAFAANKKTIVIYEDILLEDKEIAVHHDITDDKQTLTTEEPTIGTTAKDKLDDDNKIINHGIQTIVDTVEYTNLIPGEEYTIVTVLMDRSNNVELLDAEGNKVTATSKFTPEKSEGSVDVEITFDGSLAAGKTIVVFEDCLYDGKLVAVHHDITDEKQTVTVEEPKIGTTAKDKADEDKVIINHGTQTIVDTISYENLMPGTEYDIITTLMDKETGKEILDADGNKIIATVKFTPEVKKGTVDVEISFDAYLTNGKTIVIFEDVLLNSKEIAVHHDIEDDRQTIKVEEPEIRTVAVDKADGDKNLLNEGFQTIVDTISYKNLVVGETYRAVATLVDETGKEIRDVFGDVYTAEVEFVAEASEGTVEVEVDVDTSDLPGYTIVVFEDVYHGKNLVGFHHDIEDKDQTVYVPDVKTSAYKAAQVDEEGNRSYYITDKISYSNLIAGQEYTLKGTLMDKKTEKPVTDAEGNEVTATKTFKAEGTSGIVDMTFTVAAEVVEGKVTVVFEEVYKGENLFAIHADINDKAQTVYFPEYKTKVSSEEHIIDEENTMIEFTDEVTYRALKKGQKAEIHAWLVDTETGEDVILNGDRVYVVKEFTVDSENGTETLEFSFDAAIDEFNWLPDGKYVVYSELHLDGKKAFEDKDLNSLTETFSFTDEYRTYRFKKKVPNTGDATQLALQLGLFGVGSTAALGASYYLIKKSREEEEESEGNA